MPGPNDPNDPNYRPYPGGPTPPNTGGGGFVDDIRNRLGNLGNMFGGNPPHQPTPQQGPVTYEQLADIARSQNSIIIQLRGQLAQAQLQANQGETDRLRQQLHEAEIALAELEQRIGKPPLRFGTVIRINQPATPTTDTQPTTQEEQVDLTIPGTRVRLLPGHRLYGQVAPSGTVIGLNPDPAAPGTINVQFDPFNNQPPQMVACRFGLPEVENGARDIDKIDVATEQRLTDPNQFRVGSVVRMRTNPNRQGEIIAIIDPARRIAGVMWFDDRNSSEHFYGPTGELELVERTQVPEREFGKAVVAIANQIVEVTLPPNVPCRPGMTVKVNNEMQILEIAEPIGIGPIATINRLLANNEVEALLNQQKLTLKVGDLGVCIPADTTEEDRTELMRLRPGDTVVIDISQTTVIKKLPSDDTSYRFAGDTGVSWGDISGLPEAKEELIEAVETPRLNPALYKDFYHKSPPKGVLLYGPPGCGKTMLGKALATSLRQINGHTTGPLPMLSVRGPELLIKWVGETEAAIRGLFAQADRWFEKYGYPLIIFIDEADAILRTRGSGVSSDMNDTVVPMFLSLMDGLDQSHAIVILATNRQDTLDPAVTRPGRIDRKVFIPRPGQDVCKAIFAHEVAKTAIYNGSTPDDLAAKAIEAFWACGLYKVKRRSGTELIVSLGDIISGAMVVNAVNVATSLAMRRDIAAGTQTGLTEGDVINAVNSIFTQSRDLDHTGELEEFTKPFASDVDKVVRLRQRSNG